MRVQMKASMSGLRDGAEWPKVGEVIDLPDQEAADMIRVGNATPVSEDPPEQATAPIYEELATETRVPAEAPAPKPEVPSASPKPGPPAGK